MSKAMSETAVIIKSLVRKLILPTLITTKKASAPIDNRYDNQSAPHFAFIISG